MMLRHHSRSTMLFYISSDDGMVAAETGVHQTLTQQYSTAAHWSQGSSWQGC
jgi:hypothetical protein